MSSPDSSPRIDRNLFFSAEQSETPDVLYFYAPAIYGQETMRDELKEKLPSIVVEDDEEDVIKVSYYADEDNDINEDKVLKVVQGIDERATKYYKN